MPRKYSREAARKVKTVLREYKEGTLHSGRNGRVVQNRQQAIAIGISEARRQGKKVPAKPRG